MKIFKELEQGSAEWLATRWGKIGGTRSKMLGVDSNTLVIELLVEHTEDYDPEEESYKNAAMERGNDLEPEARKRLIAYTGINFVEYGWLQSEDCEILGLSPDGLSEDERFACELKCFQPKKHLEVCLTSKIPKENIDQCIQYFSVNSKLETLYFATFRPESPCQLKVIELNRWDQVDVGTKRKPKLIIVGELAAEKVAQAKETEVELKKAIKIINF